jgi:predicted phage terminase large subunit-like protein
MFASFQFGERNIRRVRAAPRGSAKSTLATLIKPIHDVCYGLEKFILIISSTTPLANKKLKDIRAEILSNSDLSDIFGVRFPTKKAGESEFIVHSDKGTTFFAALGRGSEVRGIRIGESRPTKIVADDVEYSEEVYNEKIRDKTATWFFEDVTKAGDKGTNIEFVGTVLHKDSLLAKLLRNPSYSGRVFKSIISWSERQDLWNQWGEIYRNISDSDRIEKSREFFKQNQDEMLKGTEVLWDAKENYLEHMMDLEEIGRRAFMKEKQNDPQGTDEQIFQNFHWYKETPKGLLIESSSSLIPREELVSIGCIDPATGQGAQKQMGDFTCILTGYLHTKSKRLFIHHDMTKRAPPSSYIRSIFDLNDRFQYEKFSIETNLYRNLLLPNIIDEKKRIEDQEKRRISIPFYDCVQTENKRERIFRLEPKVNHGWIVFNRALSHEFVRQHEEFPNGAHDDCPDALEQLWSLAHNRYKPAAISSLNALGGR